MKIIRKYLAALPGAVLAGTLLVAGCASSGPTRGEQLATYLAHAGAPVRQIRYHNPLGWEEVDDQHILVTMRPKEVWLMRLSGPCLDYDAGSPLLVISSQAGVVSSGFDRVSSGGSPVSCRIEEIRKVDMMAIREAARAAQASGT